MSSPGLTPAPDVSALLPYFASPGIIPPSARVDPTLKFVEPDPPTRLLFVWECGVLIVRKCVSVRTVSVTVIHMARPRARVGRGLAFAYDLRPAKEILGYRDDDDEHPRSGYVQALSLTRHCESIVTLGLTKIPTYPSEICAQGGEPQCPLANSFRRPGHSCHFQSAKTEITRYPPGM